MANAKTETETRRGRCTDHGDVEAAREIPRVRFPFVYYGVLRMLARRQPFHCPTCGAEVTTT
jgi:hypothetical protein